MLSASVGWSGSGEGAESHEAYVVRSTNRLAFAMGTGEASVKDEDGFERDITVYTLLTIQTGSRKIHGPENSNQLGKKSFSKIEWVSRIQRGMRKRYKSTHWPLIKEEENVNIIRGKLVAIQSNLGRWQCRNCNGRDCLHQNISLWVPGANLGAPEWPHVLGI